MINQVYRLFAPRSFRVDFVNEQIDSQSLLVRPTYLSICAADQRYYTGSRGKEVMSKKLPMALIHEAVGEIVYDPLGQYQVGTSVVMIPNTPVEKDSIVLENYLRTSHFRASGFDGFMQSIVHMRRDCIVPFSNISQKTAVLLELTSVVVNAIKNFELKADKRRSTIGIWGNGNIGFITALLLKNKYPESKIIVFGVENRKMNYFPFVDETYLINEIPEDLTIDHAFECVGGRGSEKAIKQIIDFIQPQGTISLMGVSELPISVDTRMVLEKGLSLLGNSRSGYEDFKDAIDIMEESQTIREYLSTIISEEIEVKSLEDVHKAFNNDLTNDFKTVMKWNI